MKQKIQQSTEMETKFVCFLELIGVGYKAITELGGKKLVLKIGYSHDIEVLTPPGIRVFCLGRSTLICCTGVDFQMVSQFAAKMKKLKPPEVYKGKGIRFRDEIIVQKQGKKK